MDDLTCQYGILGSSCERGASVRRRRPGGVGDWDVCEAHAAILDRIEAAVDAIPALLDRLADA